MGDIKRSVQLHAHLTLIHDMSNITGDVQDSKAALYLASSSYVVCWHSKSEEEDKEKKKVKEPGPAQGMMGGLFGMLMRGHAPRGKDPAKLPTSHCTPTHEVFSAIELSRPRLMRWASSCKSNVLDSVLETVVCVGLQRSPIPDELGANSKPIVSKEEGNKDVTSSSLHLESAQDDDILDSVSLIAEFVCICNACSIHNSLGLIM